MERKLASIRKIHEVQSIEEADNIEVVVIDGWQCITKKGEFSEGDECVYFEIDSFLPIVPEFEFLRKSSYRKMGHKEGFRLKTIRLRGVLSQGLALPMSILKDVVYTGDDVTEALGVIKYEPPIPAQLVCGAKGNFPPFIQKTDQERIQNLWKDIQDVIRYLSFEITVKLDGSSCTYYLLDDTFGVCSRNLEIIPATRNTFCEIAKRYDIEGLLRSYGRNIALQGEVIGHGIQKNPEKLNGQDFYLFDIWHIDEQKYLSPYIRSKVHQRHFNSLKHVPIINTNAVISYETHLQYLLDFANGPSLNNDVREGIVFKSNEGRITFKVISNEYLLKQD